MTAPVSNITAAGVTTFTRPAPTASSAGGSPTPTAATATAAAVIADTAVTAKVAVSGSLHVGATTESSFASSSPSPSTAMGGPAGESMPAAGTRSITSSDSDAPNPAATDVGDLSAAVEPPSGTAADTGNTAAAISTSTASAGDDARAAPTPVVFPFSSSSSSSSLPGGPAGDLSATVEPPSGTAVGTENTAAASPAVDAAVVAGSQPTLASGEGGGTSGGDSDSQVSVAATSATPSRPRWTPHPQFPPPGGERRSHPQIQQQQQRRRRGVETAVVEGGSSDSGVVSSTASGDFPTLRTAADNSHLGPSCPGDPPCTPTRTRNPKL